MNKTLAIAIAAAMVSPSAFAAQDTSGMQFTSASEGFYASLRADLSFSSDGGNDADGNANIDHGSSRIGVRGSNDLGGGLSGFYQWEGEVFIAGGGDAFRRARLGHVGLRGSFGEIIVGSFWANDYNWTHGGTDIANKYSGYLNYNDQRAGRASKAIQYSTPDLNGFQGAIRVDVGTNDNTIAVDEASINASNQHVYGGGNFNAGSGTSNATMSPARSDNDIDGWNIAAKYDIQGFSVGASYNNLSDRLAKITRDTNNGAMNVISYEDATSWTIKSGYAQDNWYVNAWYGEDNVSDANGALDDTEYFSIAGGISVDKVNLYVLHETRENSVFMDMSDTVMSNDDSYTTLGAQYSLGSNSRVWLEYWARDLDNNPESEDVVSVGLRHDF